MKRTGNNKIAVVGWGRGMGHKGHMYLADAVITQALHMRADPYFFVSKTVGKDDPLFPEEKIKIYQRVFPQQATIFTAQSNLNQSLEQLAQLGYQGVVLVVGADQKDAFKYLERPNKEGVPVYQSFGLKKLKVISRQETRSKFAREEGPRATPMREILMHPNASEEQKFQIWRRDMPEALGDNEVMDLMKKAEQRLMSGPKKKAKVKEFIQRVKPMLSEMTTEQKEKVFKLLESAKQLNEFAPDEGGGSRKFIPWPEFIESVKQLVGNDFTVTEKVIKSTIQDRFIPLDPMEYGPTMLYSYYEARAGRGKGAVSTRGSIQVGKYIPNSSKLGTQNFITTFNLLKGHKFERHFDLTFDNIYEIANIIKGNTQGAYQMQPQGVAEEYPSVQSNDSAWGKEIRQYVSSVGQNNANLRKQIKKLESIVRRITNPEKREQYLAKIEQFKNQIVSDEQLRGPAHDEVYYEDQQLDEFAPGNGDDGLPYAEFVVYQCDPNDQFEFIGGPLYQTDSMGMAHKYAYEHYLRYRPKAFMVYQPHAEASRGNYGVKGESDEEVDESLKSKLAAAALAGTMATGAGGVVLNPARPIGPATQNRPAPTVANPYPQPHEVQHPLNPLNPLSPSYVGKQNPDIERLKKNTELVDKEQRVNHHQLKVDEVSDKTLFSYLTKVDADARKHKSDPTKRDPKKASKSVAGFSKAFNKLDSRKPDGTVSEDYLDE